MSAFFWFKARSKNGLMKGDVCRKRFSKHGIALLRQSDFDAAAIVLSRSPVESDPFADESIEDARQGALGDQGVG